MHRKWNWLCRRWSRLFAEVFRLLGFVEFATVFSSATTAQGLSHCHANFGEGLWAGYDIDGIGQCVAVLDKLHVQFSSGVLPLNIFIILGDSEESEMQEQWKFVLIDLQILPKLATCLNHIKRSGHHSNEHVEKYNDGSDVVSTVYDVSHTHCEHLVGVTTEFHCVKISHSK